MSNNLTLRFLEYKAKMDSYSLFSSARKQLDQFKKDNLFLISQLEEKPVA